MLFKFDIAHKGKTFHLEAEAEGLMGKKIGDTVEGSEVSGSLSGAQFTITGASDKAGLPASAKVEGTGLKRVLLTKGFGLHKKHKKKKTSSGVVVKGLRLRRSLRGSTISPDVVQINLNMVKEGPKSLATMLGKEEKEKPAAAAAAEEKKEAPKAE